MKYSFLPFLLLFSLISCNKQETNYDLNIQVKSEILSSIALLYKNDIFVDSLKFQIDGTIGYWGIDIEQNSKFELNIIKLNPLDTGRIVINWFRSSNFAEQDILEFDSIAISKSAQFSM